MSGEQEGHIHERGGAGTVLLGVVGVLGMAALVTVGIVAAQEVHNRPPTETCAQFELHHGTAVCVDPIEP